MNKNLELLFNLLEINIEDQKETIKHIASLIEEYPEKEIVISHRYVFIFLAFQDFIRWNLSQEEFMQIGDIDSKTNAYHSRYSSQENIDNLLYQIQEKQEYPRNKIFIFDSKVIDRNTIADINYDALKESWSYLLFLE